MVETLASAAIEAVDEATRTSESAEGIAWSGLVDRQRDLVIEPIGDGYYVWRQGDSRGTARVQTTESKGKESTQHHELIVNGQMFLLQLSQRSAVRRFLPGGKLPFRVPRVETVTAWAAGTRKSLSIDEIIELLVQYVKLVLDLEEQYEARIDALWVIQTWLRKVSDFCGNLDLGGDFGAGKTTATQAIGELTYHGVMGSTSPASMARMNERYETSWIFDEYDKMKKIDNDGLIDLYIRQGDRRGLSVYRWNSETGAEEEFDPFGPKLINWRTSLEKGVSLVPWPVSVQSCLSFVTPSNTSLHLSAQNEP